MYYYCSCIYYSIDLPLPRPDHRRIWRTPIEVQAPVLHHHLYYLVKFSLSQELHSPQTLIFILSDFVSLFLQAGGGAIVEIATNFSFEHVGIDIMLAGLGFQVASLALFLGLCAGFAMTCLKHRDELDVRFVQLRSALRFRICLYGLLSRRQF